MVITSNILIYKGYSIKKQEQLDIHSHRYLRTIFKSHQEIIRKKIKNKEIEIPIGPQRRDIQIERRITKLPKKGLQIEIEINDRNRMPPRPQIKVSNDELNKELKKYDMEVSKLSLKDLIKHGKLLSQDDNWQLYEYNGYNYFYIKDRFIHILIKDTITHKSKTQQILILTILLNIVFICFYIFLLKKLLPLRELKKDIQEFAKGNLNINTSKKGKDEISDVSNEFNNAITQIKNLTESRNLFLRNIMHELKTPITRGFIIADMLEGNKYHKNLKKAFERLEYLLSELARLEMLTSNNIKLNKNKFRIMDILDNALDILLLEESSIDLEMQTPRPLFINVDFELFSVVIKNLIDNAIKYGEDKPKVIVNENYISISNKGEKLEKSLEEYFKPFNRSYESSTKSLGLGLYIIYSILKSHGFKLDYKYQENNNIFTIQI